MVAWLILTDFNQYGSWLYCCCCWCALNKWKNKIEMKPYSGVIYTFWQHFSKLPGEANLYGHLYEIESMNHFSFFFSYFLAVQFWLNFQCLLLLFNRGVCTRVKWCSIFILRSIIQCSAQLFCSLGQTLTRHRQSKWNYYWYKQAASNKHVTLKRNWLQVISVTHMKVRK